MTKPKCHNIDDNNSVDLETSTGKNTSPVCSIPTHRDVRHVVKITNWRRKTIKVTIEGEALNNRVIFESSNNSTWSETITIAGRGNETGQEGYHREYVTAKPTKVQNTETIKIKIVYWNKYNKNKNEEDKQVTLDIDLV